jgi:hypothetical protein
MNLDLQGLVFDFGTTLVNYKFWLCSAIFPTPGHLCNLTISPSHYGLKLMSHLSVPFTISSLS